MPKYTVCEHGHFISLLKIKFSCSYHDTTNLLNTVEQDYR